MIFITPVLKDLMKEKTRILLTIFAIAWGTFAIASMLAIGEGLRVTFAEAVSNVGTNLLLVTGGQTSENYQGISTNTPIKLTKTDLKNIKKGIPNIVSASPQYTIVKSLQYGSNNYTSAPILAVSANYAKIHSINIQSGGRFIRSLDNKKRNAVIVLGTETFNQFFNAGEDVIGKTIMLQEKPFRIIGVMAPKSQMMASEAPDAYYNWIPAKTYELMANPQTVDSFSISYKNNNLIDQTKAQIQTIIALDHGVNPNDEGIINFTDFSERQNTVNNFFFGMQIFLGIIGTLTLLVAGVGITNVMFASVKRTTHEIGIRMAIGARSWQILWHYILEAMLTTFFGGIFGLGATALLVYALRSIPMHGRLIQVIGQPKPILSLNVILIVTIILGIIGFFAGLFPAIQATKVDPTEALRYE